MIEMLSGTSSLGVRCQPAWSMSSTACAPEATFREIFRQVEVHRVGIAERQNETCSFAFPRADRAENVGGRGALIMRRRWSRSPRQLVGPLDDPPMLAQDLAFGGDDNPLQVDP